MSSNAVVRDGEVLLFGMRYRLYGLVQRTAITPLPPKMVLGDHTRSDKLVESEWVITTLSGGAGLQFARGPEDHDRFWYGTLETRYRYLTLAPEIVKAGTIAGPLDHMVEFSEQLYVARGPEIYRWDESAKDFVLLHTVSGAVTAMTPYDGSLYVLTTSALYRYDPFTNHWTEYPDCGGFALVEWDDKLYRLDNDNFMWWTVDPDDTVEPWVQAGRLPLPPGYCRQLLIYFDLAGEPAIHAITRVGVYGYDGGTYKFSPTPLTYPSTVSAGKGACVWRGELYVPVGSSIYKYNGQTIQVVGPDKDDGMPPHLRGDVVQCVPGHGFWFAVISGVSNEAVPLTRVEGLDIGWPTNDTWFANTQFHGALLVSPGVSWHILDTSLSTAPYGAAIAATTDNRYRVWWSNGEGVWYSELPVGLHNPLANPTSRYRERGEVITPWVDMGWAEIDKQARSIDLEVDGLERSGGSITVYAAWDGDEDSWHRIGTVTKDGASRLIIADGVGHLFRSVRLRIEMARGSDPTLTPVIRSCVLTYIRVPNKLFGWEITISCTDDYEGHSPEEQVANLERAMKSKLAGEFVYRARNGVTSRATVLLNEFIATETTGLRDHGRYTVSLIELDTQSG